MRCDHSISGGLAREGRLDTHWDALRLQPTGEGLEFRKFVVG